MKRILIWCLFICLICTSVSCRKVSVSEKEAESKSEQSVADSQEQTESIVDNEAPKEIESTEISPANQHQATPQNEATQEELKPDEQVTTDGAGSVSADGIAVDEEVLEQLTEQKTEQVEKPTVSTAHAELSSSSYYQYTTLSGKQRALYDRIAEAVGKSENMVSVSELAVSTEEALMVFQKFLCDHPQYFYLHRSYIYTYEKSVVNTIILRYTDGLQTDTYNEKLKMTIIADRNLIARQISELKAVVEQVVNSIPTGYTEQQKEKMIHDYIVGHVRYDYNSAANINSFGEVIPHGFDIYGAAVEGLAVCEGYGKLFQYLCYQVDMNATQVTGIAQGGNHLWNCVRIDGAWYQIDLTWADAEEYIDYSYYNLTSVQMTESHQPNGKYLSVPNCISTECSFVNTWAICVLDFNAPPQQYALVVDRVKSMGEKKLYVYIEQIEQNQTRLNDYIREQFFKSGSEVQQYLSAQGITLARNYVVIGDYVILTIQ